MTVSSGTRPYVYTRDVFTLQNGEEIGYSGILFEEPMFVLTAERAIYNTISLANRKFTKYINKGQGVSTDFEPRADGQSLDGQLDGSPGCVSFTDYIIDLRTALSGLLMNYLTEDIDYSGQQAVEDYFRVNGFPGQYALGDFNWTHPADTGTSGLGTSGNLFDIDLREVQYQPYCRVAKYEDSSGIAPSIITPIIPAFISKAGGMVNVSTTDKAHANNLIISDSVPGIVGSGYDAADSGNFLVTGDGFVSTTSKLRIGYDLFNTGLLSSTATGVCSSTDGRRLFEYLDSGIGIFVAPTLTLSVSGIYGLHVFDASKSGVLGIWPPIDNWINQNFNGYGAKVVNNEVHRGSGVHVFNEGFWGVNSSGTVLYSPLNGTKLWQRFADQTEYQTANMTSARQWADDTPTNDPGSSTTIIVGYVISFATADPLFKDEYWIYARYNKRTGALIGASENGPYTVADAASTTFMCNDISDHTPSFGINLGAYSYCNTREASDNVLQVGITDGTQALGTLSPSGFGSAEGSPELCGTIGGELVGSSSNSPLENPFRMYQIIAEDFGSFPGIAASGRAQVGEYHSGPDGTYEIMVEQELAHEFQPIGATGNWTIGNNWRIIKGQGDFAGSDFMVFNAKPSGSTSAFTYLGEVEIASSGGTNIIQVIKMLGPCEGTPRFIDDFTS